MNRRTRLLIAAVVTLAAPLAAAASPTPHLSARGAEVQEPSARSTATDSGAASSQPLRSYSTPVKADRWVAQAGSRDAYAPADHAPSSSAAQR